MDTNSLSSYQVRWAQKLSRYYFQIDYYQIKANGATGALSRFLQQDDKEEANFWAENTQIFQCLHFSSKNALISSLIATVLRFSTQYKVLICWTYLLPQLRGF